MATENPKPRRTGQLILMGLLLGILIGVLLGDYCQPLQTLGQAYVGLLQMTVLPYLVFSLIAKMGRLDVHQAKKLGLASLVVLLIIWGIGILLIVAVSAILPPVDGASFYSPPAQSVDDVSQDFLSRFVPANVFYSLSQEYVPAVVVFCLFFGLALMLVPGKEPLLDLLDVCCTGIGRINASLVRLAPLGLFLLTAAAAGTLRVDELSRLQAYLIIFALACVVATLGILPLLISSVTGLPYGRILAAAQEPLFTAFATGKLFVVLPQIVDKCHHLLSQRGELSTAPEQSTESVVVPLAYSFPHLGKIIPFVFISFAAWYSGRGLTVAQTTAMATTGTLSSFASPLVTMPFLLDQYQLPQDLMPLFILPGFLTMRLADVVGVLHLMTLTLIVGQVMQGRLQIRWPRLAVAGLAIVLSLGVLGGAGRWYLTSTTLAYDLDKRLLSLEITSPHEGTVVFRERKDVPARPPRQGTILERLKTDRTMRVGYHPDHLPYSFFNQQGDLVGLDVELMHRLASQLQLRLEFVPYDYDTVVAQLETEEIDAAIGGLMIKPERLLRVAFTEPYQTATIAIVLPDHRREEFAAWDTIRKPAELRLGVSYEDLAVAARRQLPNATIEVIDSISSYFKGEYSDLDGLLIAAEEGAAWNVLYPEYSVVIPRPVVQRPVGIAVRLSDVDWLRLLDRWLDFERLDGSVDHLVTYWIEGGGTQEKSARWCILRDVLHWIP